MIQRIQTVYLFVGAAAVAALLFFDLAWSGPAAQMQSWFTPAVVALTVLVAASGIGAIFLYANRTLQRKAVVAVQLLTVLLVLAIFGGLYLSDALTVTANGAFDAAKLAALLLPVGAYVLFFLARRAIESDIELVRSMDRLRG